MHEALIELSGGTARPGDPAVDDAQLALGQHLVVEEEVAKLAYRDGVYHSRIRRHLRNMGSEPVTQYLIRIAVDRYPGDPERSNRLYREDPLTWEEIGLSATCGEEPMTWRVKHDRDAFKELWLLFENQDGRFPLYPGESTWIDYVYEVSSRKWGPWWARAIRLPTHRLSMTVTFPARLQPVVWGIMTSMAAEASPFPTPIARHQDGDQVVFSWSTEDPPLRGGYRIEWKFKVPDDEATEVKMLSPAEQMRALDIVQEGEPVLSEVARPFDLPAEAEDARRVVAQLVSTLERVGQVHNFTKGMGLAAPQINIGRAAAVIQTPDGELITLLNPRICDQSAADRRAIRGLPELLRGPRHGAPAAGYRGRAPGHRRATSSSRRSSVASPGSCVMRWTTCSGPCTARGCGREPSRFRCRSTRAPGSSGRTGDDFTRRFAREARSGRVGWEVACFAFVSRAAVRGGRNLRGGLLREHVASSGLGA